jgi:hypothetical protein
MGLIEDFEKVEAGRVLKQYVDDIAGKITEIRTMLDELAGYRAIYPVADTEINDKLNAAVGALIALAERYK